MKLQSESKYAGDGHLYGPFERPMSQARYLVYGYMYKGERYAYHGQMVRPYCVGRNATKRFNRKVHGVRK